MLLPLVTNDVGHVLAHAIDVDADDVELLKTELRKIKKSNPAVAEFIKKWAKKCENRDGRIHSAFSGVFVYKMLENQAEADQMSLDIPLE